MSKDVKSPIRLALLFFAAAGLLPVESSLFDQFLFRAGTVRAEALSAQDPGEDEVMPFPAPRSRTKTAKKKSRASEKRSSKKADASAKKKDAETPANAVDTGDLKFSQDIAPILAKNCSGCHSGDRPGLKKGKLELTSFEKLLRGTPTNKKVVNPGNPEESSLVLRIKGEETPRMPQGNNVLSDEAISKIERWVKSGATLDPGIDRKAAIDTYAASPEQLLRRELAKLTTQQRDKKVEEVGLARWKQAGDKLKPKTASSERFMMFSNLPSERTTRDLKILDRQYALLKNLLGSPTMDWVEKVSVYVFSTRKDFVEFVRTVESREIDADTVSSAKLTGAEPYVAVVDPLGGKKEEPQKRKARSKRGEDKDSISPDRSLAGLLTEALGTAVVASAGDPPRWLKEGIGTYLAAQVEPRSPYYPLLRHTAFAKFQQGWETKAAEVLGGSDKIPADELHAVSFALVESMLSSDLRPGFPTFVNGMMGGTGKLDEMLRKVYEYNSREEFFVDTGDFVATRYGRAQ